MKFTKKKGFTIVELVIVIAVIGILSAVLIPTFSGLIDKANETALQEGLRNAYTEYVSNYTYSSNTPTLYSRDKVVFSVDEMNETDGIYTITASTANSPVYYSTEDGKFAECQTEQTSDTFLGQFNGYYAYAVE